MSCKVTAVCVTHTPFPSFKIQANDDVTNPSMQHYATPYSQCRRHGRHDRNADNTGGTRCSEFYGSVRHPPHSQWRQKLIIGESFDDRDDRHARETFPYSDLKGKEQVLEYICTYFDFPEYAMLPVPQANSHRH